MSQQIPENGCNKKKPEPLGVRNCSLNLGPAPAVAKTTASRSC